jgi:hypothetical protein
MLFRRNSVFKGSTWRSLHNTMQQKARAGRKASSFLPKHFLLRENETYILKQSKVQENQVGLKLKGTYELLVYADDMNL